MKGYTVFVEREITAPAERLFGLIADPAMHPRFDGSGMAQAAAPDSPRSLKLGDCFGMSMRQGIGYRTMNRIVELEPDHRIAWQTTVSSGLGRLIGGRIWRYELEARDASTLVRETWDLSRDHERWLLRLGPLPVTTKKNMERSLKLLEKLALESPIPPPEAPSGAPEDPG